MKTLIDGKRFYDIEGQLMPSVTTVIGILSKGVFFERWLASKSAEESKELTDTAADLGTRVHAHIENIIKGQLGNEILEDEKPAVQAFYDWQNKFNPVYKSSEIFLYSKKFKYAGTCDIIALVDGKLCLIDAKTSSRCYDTMGLQLSAYATAYTEMTGTKIEKLFILRLDKLTGKYQWKEYRNDFNVFKAVLKVFNWRNNGVGKSVKRGSGKSTDTKRKRVTGSNGVSINS